jgi:hypothetical protein
VATEAARGGSEDPCSGCSGRSGLNASRIGLEPRWLLRSQTSWGPRCGSAPLMPFRPPRVLFLFPPSHLLLQYFSSSDPGRHTVSNRERVLYCSSLLQWRQLFLAVVCHCPVWRNIPQEVASPSQLLRLAASPQADSCCGSLDDRDSCGSSCCYGLDRRNAGHSCGSSCCGGLDDSY